MTDVDGLDLPEGLELARDVSPADWIVERLWPWGTSPTHGTGRTRVGSFAPSGFDAYARILHPAHGGVDGDETVRWKTLADENGVSLRPESTFTQVSGFPLGDAQTMDRVGPLDGSLPQDETRALAQLLERFTSTPNRCWFCVWVGQGYWWDGSHGPLTEEGTDREENTSARARRGVSRERDSIMRRAAQVRVQNREYFLFRGELRHADAFPPIEGPWFQSPNLWWPEDRAWCVVTEIDGYSTYVGGTRACIDAVRASTEVEAIEVSLEDRFPTEYTP